MPKFQKSVKDLESRFDKWMYVIRNLNKLDRLPDELKEGVFEKLFEVAEIAKFSPEEVRAYEDSLKSYRDLKNSLDTAREEGSEQRAFKIALKALEKGMTVMEVSQITGLSVAQIEKLKENEG
jgi:predicted transposase/invertase (TIGR01784 family)